MDHCCQQYVDSFPFILPPHTLNTYIFTKDQIVHRNLHLTLCRQGFINFFVKISSGGQTIYKQNFKWMHNSLL